MSSNADVKIIVTLHDQGSRNLLQQLGLIDSATGKVNASAVQAGGALRRMGSDGAQGMRAAGTSAQSVESHMRGIGTAARTSGAQIGNMRQPLAAIDTQVRGIGERMKSWGSMGAQAVAGFTAAKMVIAAKIKPEMDYETQAQHTANTLYHDRDGAGKIAGRAVAEEKVSEATKLTNGGMQREEVMSLLGSLAGGGMAREDAYAVLPQLAKAQIGAQMDSNSFADLTNTLASAGFKGDELVNKISAIVKGGQLGTFEADSMVKNGLSQAILNYKNMGMTKEDSTNQAVADFQMAKKATGNDSTAATSILNMQNKIMSADLQAHFKKEFKIDLRAELKKEVAGGNTISQGFQNVVDRLIASGKAPANVKKELKGLRDAQNAGAGADEINEKIEAIRAIDTSGMLSDVLLDMQALMGLKSSREFKAVGEEVKTAMVDDKGKAVQGNYEANTSTANASDTARKNASKAADEKLMNEGGSTAIKAVNDGLTSFANEFPNLTAALSLTTSAVEALTAAVIASGAAGLLTRSATGAATGAATAAATTAGGAAAVGTGAGAAGWLSKAGGMAKSAGVVGAAGTALWNAGGNAMTMMDDKAGAREKSEAKGGLVGAAYGTVVGGVIGSVVPVLGTALGAAAGAWLGGMAGAWVGGKNSDAPPATPAITPATGAPLTFSNQYGMSDQSKAAHSAQLRALAAPPPIQGGDSAQALIQSNAQLQQVNAQIAQLNQISNNAPLEAQMTAVAGSVAALASKPAPVTNITSNLVVDGSVVATMVNRYNGGTVARGA